MVHRSNDSVLRGAGGFVTFIFSLQSLRAHDVSKAKAISAQTIAPQAIIAFAAAGALCLQAVLRLSALLLISP